MDKQQFKEKFDAKPLSICEEEEEDEDDWFPYLNKTSDEVQQKTSNVQNQDKKKITFDINFPTTISPIKEETPKKIEINLQSHNKMEIEKTDIP